ncbi:MAG: hypothetical protein DI636_05675 [Pelagerythrobacter marensis]|nr:MAG: hypothetical protein DI636_05675 [Pelagerythrobacter marensis]
MLAQGPWPSVKRSGTVAERIREHRECDVAVTAMLLRWLVVTGELRADRMRLDALIADSVARLRPYRPQLLAALAGFRREVRREESQAA